MRTDFLSRSQAAIALPKAVIHSVHASSLLQPDTVHALTSATSKLSKQQLRISHGSSLLRATVELRSAANMIRHLFPLFADRTAIPLPDLT